MTLHNAKETCIISCVSHSLQQVVGNIFKCEEPDEKGLCVFEIQLYINEVPLMMTPKQMYYGSIPIGKYDYYTHCKPFRNRVCTVL